MKHCRTFEQFPEDATCPICNTSENKECVLIGISGTEEGNIMQAQPFHFDCVAKKINESMYWKESKIVAFSCEQVR